MNFDMVMKNAQVSSLNAFKRGQGIFLQEEKDLESLLLDEISNQIKDAKSQIPCDVFVDESEKDKRIRPDIIAGDTAVELTYRPRSAVILGHELKKGSTENSSIRGGYKVWRDLWKIEHLVNSDTNIKSGYVVVLTNNDKYWDADKMTAMQEKKNWWLREFFLHDGREVSGKLNVNWDGSNVRKTLRQGFKYPEHKKHDEGIGTLTLYGKYKLEWQDWTGFPEDKNGEYGRFRYLVLQYPSKNND